MKIDIVIKTIEYFFLYLVIYNTQHTNIYQYHTHKHTHRYTDTQIHRYTDTHTTHHDTPRHTTTHHDTPRHTTTHHDTHNTYHKHTHTHNTRNTHNTHNTNNTHNTHTTHSKQRAAHNTQHNPTHTTPRRTPRTTQHNTRTAHNTVLTPPEGSRGLINSYIVIHRYTHVGLSGPFISLYLLYFYVLELIIYRILLGVSHFCLINY